MRINAFKLDAILARGCISRAKLAELTGISRQSVSTILLRGTCSTVNAGRIARALGVDVTEIMEDVGIDNSKGF